MVHNVSLLLFWWLVVFYYMLNFAYCTGLHIHTLDKVMVKLSLCFNWAPCYEGVWGEWRYMSTHSLTSTLYGGESASLTLSAMCHTFVTQFG